MNFKYALAGLALTSSLFGNSLRTNNIKTDASPRPSPRAAVDQTTRIQTIKDRSDKEIDNRLTSLNNALSAVAGAKKLNATDKANFTAEIQTDISILTALKAKIDADTDLTTLRTDAKSIFTDYRVYAVFLPQIHLLAAADIMGVTADNLTTIANKLATRLQTLQSGGKDVSALQTILNDMNVKIADAKTQYAAVETEVIGLTPASYPGSSATLKDARTKIKAGATDLKAARDDAKKIVEGIKGL